MEVIPGIKVGGSGLEVVGALFACTQVACAHRTVRCFGNNSFGQCDVPSALGALVQVAAGGDNGGGGHEIALRADGMVQCWGAGLVNLGCGPANWRQVLQRIPPAGLADVVQVAAGMAHSLALLRSGEIVMWGSTCFSYVYRGVGPFVEVAVGACHSIARRADGTIALWGPCQYAGELVCFGHTLPPPNPGVSDGGIFQYFNDPRSRRAVSNGDGGGPAGGACRWPANPDRGTE